MRTWIVALFVLISCSKEHSMIVVSLAPQKVDGTLDPLDTQYTNQFYLLENLTSRLVALDKTGQYKLDLAESIVEGHEREYIIKIKECFFSNGERVSLEDVKNSLDRTINNGSRHVDLKNVVEKTEIKNNSLYVYFTKNSKPFLYYLSLPDMGILHKSQYTKTKLLGSDFLEVSSGPYKYHFDGNNYFLIKNNYYSLGPTNYPDKVKLLGSWGFDIMDMTLKGELNLGQVSLRKYLAKKDNIAKRNNIRIIGVPSDSLTYIVFNEHSLTFKKESHRRWLRTVIDKHISVPAEYENIARRTKQYFPPESKAFLPEAEVESILKEIAIEARPQDFPSQINIHTYTTGFDVTIEPLIRKLETISGLKIKILDTIDPFAKMDKLKNGEIDLFIEIMSTDVRVPVEAINFEFFSKGAVLKDNNGYVRKHFDNYLDAKSDYEEVRSLQEISRLIIRNDQIIPLFHNAIPVVYDASKIDLEGLSHLFIFNFWKLKVL